MAAPALMRARRFLVGRVSQTSRTLYESSTLGRRSISSEAKLNELANESRAAQTTESPGDIVEENREGVVKPDDGHKTKQPAKRQQKTMAQLDQELMQKMAGLAGDGGESGIEYEDGKPVAMKRGVRENMFRYI